jgi:hypothetical protein
MHHAWVVLVIALASCVSEPAAIPQSGDFVGTWRYRPYDPTRTAVEDREVVELRADGTYAIRDKRSTEVGTYVVADGAITTHASTGQTIVTGVAATADALIIGAMFAGGDNDGVLGTWVGKQVVADATTMTELVVAGDGTAHVVETADITRTADATWVEEDPFVVVTFTDPTRTKPLPVLPGVAIGSWLYERAE